MTTIEAYPEAVPYDTALPQDFVDDVRRLTGEEAFGRFVWSYTLGSSFGFAYPTDAKGVRILTQYITARTEERVLDAVAQWTPRS